MAENEVLIQEWQRNKVALEMNDFQECTQHNCEASRYKLKGTEEYKAERDTLQL